MLLSEGTALLYEFEWVLCPASAPYPPPPPIPLPTLYIDLICDITGTEKPAAFGQLEKLAMK